MTSRKNESHLSEKPGIRTEDTASSLFTLNSGVERPGRSSSLTDDIAPRAGTKRQTKNTAMRLTKRDQQIVHFVLYLGAVRADQVQVALFGPGGRSRCHERLKLLVCHHYLDRLPRKRVNDPDIYVLNRRSIKGNRLLREGLGEAELRRQMVRLGPIDHLLAVNEVRVRVERACGDLGWKLHLWQHPQDLAPLLQKFQLVPDGYFQIRRIVAGQERTSGFFLELERASKSRQVIRSKLQRYADLYYSGRYEEIFRTRALRVLFVFAASDDKHSVHLIETSMEEAKRIGVTNARFANLGQIKNLSAVSCLTAPIWYAPDTKTSVALFSIPVDS